MKELCENGSEVLRRRTILCVGDVLSTVETIPDNELGELFEDGEYDESSITKSRCAFAYYR
jgi:hypothetical protein